MNEITDLPTLRNYMKRVLRIFNNEGENITNDLIHNKVLAPEDLKPFEGSQYQYQKAVQRRLVLDTGKWLEIWPDGWMEKSVAEWSIVLWNIEPS